MHLLSDLVDRLRDARLTRASDADRQSPPNPPFTRGGKEEGGAGGICAMIWNKCKSGAIPTLLHPSLALPESPKAIDTGARTGASRPVQIE